ncbi:MAG TPA: polymer-forming cytoskeletal protein [Candidatus Atribacteria bacterium]|nr:polymer-forming cytoskeletal protein [Candidatus Atribacteria bacterium]HPZ81112.1 polymer-forming cytoskeletal protein [Candidatus Atribacteria bacterium]HQE25209.1 polymer-forming cytoskeletal protein [Candidatus Atribacteria bacterium]
MRKSTEKGSVLISVLILIIIVVLIMVAVASFITGGIQRTKATSSRLQALYLAEAGVDKAIEQLKEDWDTTFPTPWPSSSPSPSYLPFPTSSLSDKVGEYGFIIPPDKGSGERIIEGYGKVEIAGREEIIEKVTIAVKSSVLTFNNALFADGKINMGVLDNGEISGSPHIKGDVATNADDPGSVNLSWGAQIDGDLYVGPGANHLGPGVNSDYVVTIPENNPKKYITRDVKTLEEEEEIVYPSPEFPDYPTGLDERGNLEITNPATINENGYYESITVNGNTKLYINTGEENKERIILVKNFNLNQGHIILQGSGKLKLYVKNGFTMGTGDSTLNYGTSGEGDPAQVTLYYGGTGDFKLLGNVKINGTVVVNNAKVVIGGSAVLKGNLITGGDKEITIKEGSNSAEVRGVVYAPNAKVTLSNSGSVEGAVVCKEFSSFGVSPNETVISYNTSVIEATPFPADVLSSTGSGGISIASWQSESITTKQESETVQ